MQAPEMVFCNKLIRTRFETNIFTNSIRKGGNTYVLYISGVHRFTKYAFPDIRKKCAYG